MALKSVLLLIPNVIPYDLDYCWFESFLGNNIMLLVDSIPLKRFWFTRYADANIGRYMKFRFEIDDLSLINDKINDLLAKYGTAYEGYCDYNVRDLGTGEQSRFLGQNNRHQDPVRRGNIAFDCMHGAARLCLDCLAGPDSQGHYYLEQRKKNDGFSFVYTMEQFHHLFCSVTGSPIFLGEVSHPIHQPAPQWMSWDEYKPKTREGSDEKDRALWKFENVRMIPV